MLCTPTGSGSGAPLMRAGIAVKVVAVARARYHASRSSSQKLLPSAPKPNVSERPLLGLPDYCSRQTRATFTTEAQQTTRTPKLPHSLEKSSNTVVVSSLPPNVNAKDLRDIFRKYGFIVHTNIQKDVRTGASLGFGFVRFDTRHSAQRALELDEQVLDIAKHPIRVRVLPDRLNEVFVRGLSWSVDVPQLRALFERCGEVVDARVRIVRYGRQHKVFGFVTFSSPASARKALTLDGMMVDEKKLSVVLSRPSHRTVVYHDMDDMAPTSTTIQVDGLPPQMDDDWLYKEFSRFGEIVTARIQRQLVVGGSRGFGNSLGFGHVRFTSDTAVDNALKLGHIEVAGHTISMRLTDSYSSVLARQQARSLEPGQLDPTRLYVAALPLDLDNDTLRREFERFGRVLHARVVKDHEKRKSLGFGFVRFATRESVDKAIQHEGIRINGFSITVCRAAAPRMPKGAASNS